MVNINYRGANKSYTNGQIMDGCQDMKLNIVITLLREFWFCLETVLISVSKSCKMQYSCCFLHPQSSFINCWAKIDCTVFIRSQIFSWWIPGPIFCRYSDQSGTVQKLMSSLYWNESFTNSPFYHAKTLFATFLGFLNASCLFLLHNNSLYVSFVLYWSLRFI